MLKQVFLTPFVILGLLSGHCLEARYPVTNNAQQTAEASELQYLIQQCNLIRAHYAAQYSAINACSSSAYLQAVRFGITQYLQQTVGTPVALRLLNEIRVNNFKDYL